MTTQKNQRIWPYAEALAHMDELLGLAANGEPQQITDQQGRTFTVQVQEAAKPFVSVLSIYDDAPKDDSFKPERLHGSLNDLNL